MRVRLGPHQVLIRGSTTPCAPAVWRRRALDLAYMPLPGDHCLVVSGTVPAPTAVETGKVLLSSIVGTLNTLSSTQPDQLRTNDRQRSRSQPDGARAGVSIFS